MQLPHGRHGRHGCRAIVTSSVSHGFRIVVVQGRNPWISAVCRLLDTKPVSNPKYALYASNTYSSTHNRVLLSGITGSASFLGATVDANIVGQFFWPSLVFFGLSPKLGPIAEWGMEMAKNQIPTDTEKFETSEPGIYAVGDIATYPGKKKLILSGFHEGALAAFAIKARIEPDKKVHLQYTTTSPIMHERLGVKE